MPESIRVTLAPREASLAGLPIGRLLPRREQRALGPFVFMDRFGPTAIDGGLGLQVPPHPHIGLATVTYLFSGELVHRDSVGSTATIVPGGLNWMTAGRGIVHSERSPSGARASLDGVQFWVALPPASEECEPRFEALEADSLPTLDLGSGSGRVLAGTYGGLRAPTRVDSELFLVDVELPAGGSLELASDADERGVYPAEGVLEVNGTPVEPGRLAVLEAGGRPTLRAPAGARLILFGGAPLDGPRHMDWNFISSSRERVQSAMQDWQAGRFPTVDHDPGDPA
ncbi:MAG: pirin family protein [Planctomycetota bacterium]